MYLIKAQKFMQENNKAVLNVVSSYLNKQYLTSIQSDLDDICNVFNNPNVQRFSDAFFNLPTLSVETLDLLNDKISLENKSIDKQNISLLKTNLKALLPWRKGPFNVFGVDIQTEWQSQLKWNRLKDHINLKNKTVLDVGCSSGYYMFKMLPQDPRHVIGIDPSDLFYFQFHALQKYIQDSRLSFLKLKLEHMQHFEASFDTIFCMGILYHQRSPLECLKQLRLMLKRKGELILETIIIPGDEEMSLTPKERYCQMKNVYFIPTLPAILNWCKIAKLHNVEVLDNSLTTVEEQRATEWTYDQSFVHFLDPKNPELTVEGYPRPRRILLKCRI